MKENKRFNIVARIKSSTHALRGLIIMIKTTHNAWLHLFFGIWAIYLGFILNITLSEWIAVVFAIFIVLITETINTAFEVDIDLTSPEYHPYARDTKDIAAGAVLLAVVLAIIVGLIIFLPKILAILLV
jgi:diacylglycerol kinase